MTAAVADTSPTRTPTGDLSLDELVQLCAVDAELFHQTFFPKTFRQKSAPFHYIMDRMLNSNARLVMLQAFRGSSKTTRLRTFTAKRIAYGLARTVVYVGKSEGHAIRSLRWIKRQVLFNPLYAKTFNLVQGDKWADSEVEIKHAIEGHSIFLVGMGITGSTRGINFDDYRPDLIVVDDVLDEENSSTVEQREKIENLIYGALKDSLAPASEMPDAKMVALQTPMNKEDFSMKALEDKAWLSGVFGCWTPETANAPMAQQQSAWEERFPTQVLRLEKQQAADRNKLSLFLREMECRITSPETSSFREEWLKTYDTYPELQNMQVVMVIDPVPPPTETAIQKGFKDKDYEALVIVGLHRGNYYLLDYSQNRGHDPSWTVAEFFRLAYKWNPRRVIVETTAYQATLAWLLRQAMNHQRRYFAIKEFDQKRKTKYNLIVDALNGPGSNGKLYIHISHRDFRQQWREYPNVAHDDLINGAAIGVQDLTYALGDPEDDGADYESSIMASERNIPRLRYNRGAP